MNHVSNLLIALVLVPLGSGAEVSKTQATTGAESRPAEAQNKEAVALFNGEDLEAWHAYVDDPGVDPKSVWEVRDGAIWCKGEPFGFIRTKNGYDDFKLVVEWRWPEKPGNSGVLLRMSDEDKVWPRCMEAQLKYKQAGDVVGMGCDFNENKSPAGEFFRFAPRKNRSNETKPGTWNRYEIVCKGDAIALTVNGLVQNKATGVGVRRGYVGLQSEGAPIMFKNITLTPLR